MIVARYTPQNIQVEVTGVLETSGGRKVVQVRALAGEPFQVNTHGGPMHIDTANVRRDQLTDIRKADQVNP